MSGDLRAYAEPWDLSVLLRARAFFSPLVLFWIADVKRLRGTASRWNDKGFCFLKPEDGGEEVFCHSSGIKDGNCIREGATVEFDNTFDERKGKPRAENVTGGFYEDRRAPRDSTPATSSIGVFYVPLI
jgi:cold shock CspA family protein